MPTLSFNYKQFIYNGTTSTFLKTNAPYLFKNLSRVIIWMGWSSCRELIRVMRVIQGQDTDRLLHEPHTKFYGGTTHYYNY